MARLGCLPRATGGNVLPVFIFLLCKLIEELMLPYSTPLFPGSVSELGEGGSKRKSCVRACVCACVRERASVCARINKMALVFCLDCDRSG